MNREQKILVISSPIITGQRLDGKPLNLKPAEAELVTYPRFTAVYSEKGAFATLPNPTVLGMMGYAYMQHPAYGLHATLDQRVHNGRDLKRDPEIYINPDTHRDGQRN